MNERMEVFLESFLPDPPHYLMEIAHISEKDHVPIIRKQTEKLLEFFIRTYNVGSVLEIGTAIGYSALCMAACKKDIHIDTIEKVSYRVAAAQNNFLKYDKEGRISLFSGDAADILPELISENKQYDMVFMDAAKGQYHIFAEYAYRLLKPGGLLITDNVMQEGEVLESRYAVTRRNRTIHARMREFIYEYTHSELWESIVLPIGDGVMVSIKSRGINYENEEETGTVNAGGQS